MNTLRPLMRKSEIHAIEEALLSLNKKHVNVLEWGSGGSTRYFTDFLKRQGITYTWISLEYNKDWYEKVKEDIGGDPGIQLVLFDTGNKSLKQRGINMDDYVAYPSTTNMQFDFVLVDGRKRRRCVLQATKVLSPDGVVFLHDAQRGYYHSAFHAYPDSFFVTPFLWRGRLKEVDVSTSLLNLMNNIAQRIYYFAVYYPFYSIKRIVRRFVYSK